MSDKKHIDRIFQEKFKDFEATPSPQVWKSIQDKLNKPEKERKRIIPFWFRVAGIAAILLILLTVGGLVLNNITVDSTDVKVVGTDNTSTDSTNFSNEIIVNSSVANTPTGSNNQVENLESSNSQSQATTNSLNNSSTSNISEITSGKALKDSKTKSLINKDKQVTEDIPNKNAVNNSTTIKNDTRITENASSKNDVTADKKATKFNKKNLIGNKNDSRIIQNTSANKGENSNKNVAVINTKITGVYNTPSASTVKNNIGLTENITNKNNVNSDKKASKINTKDTTGNNNLAEYNASVNDGKNVSNEGNSELDKTNTDKEFQYSDNLATKNAIAEKENTEDNIEEIIVEELNKKDLTIEEAIAANKELIEEEKDEVINRWQVYANIAPVYYNSMGKGSQIDEQFNENSKTGEVNTSYGVNVSYNLNKKLSIRTGLSSLNLSYDTNDVIIYQSIASTGSAPSAFKNIDLSEGNETLTAISGENLSVSQIGNSLSPNSNAAINQRISYYEIPMELNYRIGNNKVGLNIIAGFSSFILDNNEVYSELKDKKTYIGEANNINSMSFSTNFGLGLDYKFSEKVKFNLEPTFKYQLNAFENTSGSFNPYIIGVYTGFSYKF